MFIDQLKVWSSIRLPERPEREKRQRETNINRERKTNKQRETETGRYIQISERRDRSAGTPGFAEV